MSRAKVNRGPARRGESARDARNRKPSDPLLQNTVCATRDDAVELAYQWFLAGRRIDMQQLALELGIGRATLYRWWRSREVIIGEVIWRIMIEAIDRIDARSRSRGQARLVRNFGRFADTVRTFEPLVKFVSEEPDYALRALTSRFSVVQGRLIALTAAELAALPDIDPNIDVRDLAYTIVRIGESFIWSDMITGDPPRSDKAAAMVDLLLTAARKQRTDTPTADTKETSN
jgi:AcrR family transcriptional regulator